MNGGLSDADLMTIMMMHLNHGGGGSGGGDQMSLHNGGASSSLATTALPTVMTPAGLYTADNENFILAPYSSHGQESMMSRGGRHRYLRRVSRRMPDGTVSSKLEYVYRSKKRHNMMKRAAAAAAAAAEAEAQQQQKQDSENMASTGNESNENELRQQQQQQNQSESQSDENKQRLAERENQFNFDEQQQQILEGINFLGIITKITYVTINNL
jgi:hypothetical protein